MTDWRRAVTTATRSRWCLFHLDEAEDSRDALNILNRLIRVTDRAYLMSDNEIIVILPETSLEGGRVFAQRCVMQIIEDIGTRAFAGVADAIDGTTWPRSSSVPTKRSIVPGPMTSRSPIRMMAKISWLASRKLADRLASARWGLNRDVLEPRRGPWLVGRPASSDEHCSCWPADATPSLVMRALLWRRQRHRARLPFTTPLLRVVADAFGPLQIATCVVLSPQLLVELAPMMREHGQTFVQRALGLGDRACVNHLTSAVP